jgi:primosomal protein N' (replication factor Y)
VCPSCGASRHRNLRLGVGRAREELEALAGEPVVEVTAATPANESDDARILIGTTAVLHARRAARVVAFLDFDQELLAPRFRACEQAFAMVGKAARMVGGAAGEARVLLQTRQPDHEVVRAALHGDPGLVERAERERRELLALPPVTAMALVSGPGAPAFVDSLELRSDADVLGPLGDRWLVKAADHETLSDVLASGSRGPERLRVEVDPLRV